MGANNQYVCGTCGHDGKTIELLLTQQPTCEKWQNALMFVEMHAETQNWPKLCQICTAYGVCGECELTTCVDNVNHTIVCVVY